MSANKASLAAQGHAAPLSTPKKRLVDRRYYYSVTVGSISLVAAVLLSFLVIKPLVDKSLSTAKDLQYRTQEVSELNTKLNNMKTLKQNFLALGTDTENKILVAMPTDADEAHLTSLLATVAGQSGVRLLSISYQGNTTPAATTSASAAPTPPPSVQAQTLPITLTVTGSYGNSTTGIAGFLGALEHAPRVMDVTQVNISGSSPSLSASIQVNAFYNPVSNQ